MVLRPLSEPHTLHMAALPMASGTQGLSHPGRKWMCEGASNHPDNPAPGARLLKPSPQEPYKLPSTGDEEGWWGGGGCLLLSSVNLTSLLAAQLVSCATWHGHLPCDRCQSSASSSSALIPTPDRWPTPPPLLRQTGYFYTHQHNYARWEGDQGEGWSTSGGRPKKQGRAGAARPRQTHSDAGGQLCTCKSLYDNLPIQDLPLLDKIVPAGLQVLQRRVAKKSFATTLDCVHDQSLCVPVVPSEGGPFTWLAIKLGQA